jgi:hypothetical protein
MVEIVFDGSTEGNLKEARAWSRTNNKECEIKQSFILCFDWRLETGTLQDGIDSKYRRELPLRLYMQGYHGDDKEENISSIGDTALKNWAILKELLHRGEPIRIWYGQSPHTVCGFYHICSLLRDYENEVYVMKCPEIIKGRDSWFFIHGWGTMNGADIGQYLYMSRKLNKEEVNVYAKYWDTLVEENAQFRAIIGERPVSVREDFYDEFIERYFPKEPIKESELIGEIMDNMNFGVYDYIYQIRIDKMIEDGRVKVIQTAERDMNRIIQKI